MPDLIGPAAFWSVPDLRGAVPMGYKYHEHDLCTPRRCPRSRRKRQYRSRTLELSDRNDVETF